MLSGLSIRSTGIPREVGSAPGAKYAGAWFIVRAGFVSEIGSGAPITARGSAFCAGDGFALGFLMGCRGLEECEDDGDEQRDREGSRGCRLRGEDAHPNWCGSTVWGAVP